jgi:uncharacterized protein (TIGR03083 family)
VPELSDGYHATRQRIIELVRALGPDAYEVGVPACPEWTVHDLVAHLCGIPEALTTGNAPTGAVQPWLDSLVVERADVPVPELLERWDACAAGAAGIVDGGGHQLFVDVVTHEHDLRAAVGRPGARGTAEVRACVQLSLDLLAPAIAEAGLGALVVDSGEVRWASQFARPGCTLRVDPWEAVRTLQSRRTADEVRSLPMSGDVEPYLAVLAGHLPLPEHTLGELDVG